MSAEEQKARDRAMWAAGDYAVIGDFLWSAGSVIVERVGVQPGERVLDVACGSGNAAIQAAQAGGDAVGVDLAPELFPAARARAEAAGVAVEWVEGDAEALPFPDESFDVVLSTFGCMFTPRHEAAASELARVLRPGGRIGLCNWSPEGEIGDFFATIGRHVPPPPPTAVPPLLWGTEDYVRGLFAGSGVELEFERNEIPFSFASAEEAVATYEANFGPIVMAKQLLEPEGRWAALRADFVELYGRHAVEPGGAVAFGAEYLVVFGRKTG